MLPYPLEVFDRQVESPTDLREMFRHDAHFGPLRPADLHPAQTWVAAMEASPSLRDEVEHLAVELIGVEDDPVVLGMILALGGAVGGLLDEAAARRLLDGPPVPEAPGVQFPTLAEDLRQRANRTEDAALRTRLAGTANPLDALRAALDAFDPKVVDALERAVDAGTVPVPLAAAAGMITALLAPDQLPRAAAAVRRLPAAQRKEFLTNAVSTAPAWREQILAALGEDAS